MKTPLASPWRWALVLFLAMASLDRNGLPLAAATTSAGGSRHAPVLPANCTCQLVSPTPSPRLLYAAWTNNVLGNRDRMIQVTFITIAIGIFFLSRSTK